MDDRGQRLMTQPGQNQVYVPVKNLGHGSKRLPGNISIDHIDLHFDADDERGILVKCANCRTVYISLFSKYSPLRHTECLAHCLVCTLDMTSNAVQHGFTVLSEQSAFSKDQI